MKPLVIGGTGFIGINIIRALQAKGINTRCTRRKSSNTLFVRKLKPELVYATLDDEDSLRYAMTDCDTVFMAAGHYPRYSLNKKEHVEKAVRRTNNCINAALESGIKHFIYTSSIATANWRTMPAEIIDETSVAHSPPLSSVYHAVKIASEQTVLKAAQRGLPAVVMCPTGCFGEFDIKAGTGFIFPAIARGLMKFCPDGKINIVDTDAVAEAHVYAAKRDDLTGKRYILSGHNITVFDLISKLCSRYKLKRHIKKLPLIFAMILSSMDEWCCMRSKTRRPFISREFIDILRYGRFVCNEKAVSELCLQVPSLEHTLDKAWNWYAKYGFLGPEYKHLRSSGRIKTTH